MESETNFTSFLQINRESGTFTQLLHLTYFITLFCKTVTDTVLFSRKIT